MSQYCQIFISTPTSFFLNPFKHHALVLLTLCNSFFCGFLFYFFPHFFLDLFYVPLLICCWILRSLLLFLSYDVIFGNKITTLPHSNLPLVSSHPSNPDILVSSRIVIFSCFRCGLIALFYSIGISRFAGEKSNVNLSHALL